jgi:UDP-GlcNAc:undecaprenyl-phosphate GlcNAc-1-phosphate transferase
VRDYLFILIIAATVTYLLTPLVRSLAIKINAQHAARSRDVHTEPTPLIGGLAMYGGLVAALLVAERLTYLRSAFPSARTVDGLLAAGGLLVLIGIVDDRWGMSAISKLAGQIAAGGILAWSGVYLPWLPLPGGDTFVLEPDLSYTLTILLVVITINAVNFIDGLDGLAAGVVGIAGLSFLIYSYTLTNSLKIPSQSVPAVASAVLVGICAGFLPHNFNPARIFMGDTGALGLGGLIGGLAVSTRTTLLSIIIGGLFVIVTMSVVIQIISFKTTGKRVFRMSPLQHHFELAGWSEVNIVVRFWIVAGICVAIGLGLFYSDFLAVMG